MDERITLAHGAGGEKYRELVEEVFMPAYGSSELAAMGDSAVCAFDGKKLAFTTDGFVVKPLFFPGGDIGSLCISGTVNDIAMSGAKPLYISVAMILEEGLETQALKRICESIAKTAKAAGVRVVTGDTKVVERGKADKIYITTSGVGAFCGDIPLQRVQAGDVIICSGTIANHGMAVMAAREGLEFEPMIMSDARPLNGLVAAALGTGARVNALRDPTRGGVCATICEWSGNASYRGSVTPHQSATLTASPQGEAFGGCDEASIDIIVEESALPLRADTAGACRILGIDALNVANEGICLMSVEEKDAKMVLDALHAHEYGRDAAIIGKAVMGTGNAYLLTEIGTRRRLFMPRGEILPRIC